MPLATAGILMGSRTGKWIWAIVVTIATATVFAVLIWYSRPDRGGNAPPNPAELEQQAREHPDDFLAQLRWGEALVHAKRFEEATPILTHAEQLTPNDPRPYALQGMAASSAQHYEEARSLFHEALHRDASNVTAIRGLSNLYAAHGRRQLAIHGFEMLVKLQPNDADAWQRLGILLMPSSEIYRSLDALTRAAQLAPNDLMTQDALGNIALACSRLDQADRAFRTVLSREPNDPQALTGLAVVRMRLDPSPASLKAAEQQIDIVLHTAPSASAYRARGQIRMAQRRLPEAIEDFKASQKLDPRDRDTYSQLSQCYASSGRSDLARKESAEFDRLLQEQRTKDKILPEFDEATK